MPSTTKFTLLIIATFIAMVFIACTPSRGQVDTTPFQPTPQSASQGQSPAPTPLAATLRRLTAAYGGQALLKLKTVSIQSDRRLAWPGQGHSAAFVNFVHDRQIRHIDLINEVGLVERWIDQNGNAFHSFTEITARGGRAGDLFAMTAQAQPEASFLASFAPDIRSVDLLMAHRLATGKTAATHQGTAYVHDQVHDLLTATLLEGSPEMTIYVGRQSGLISQITLTRCIGEVVLAFDQPRTQGGVTYAAETHVFLNQTLVEFEQETQVSVNTDISTLTTITLPLRTPPMSVDHTAMTVDEIAPGLYHVGQDDYSLFAQTDAGLVVVNSASGLLARYDALAAHLGRRPALTHAIATHHHSDHMDGIEVALDLGATIMVTGAARETVTTRQQFTAYSDRFETMTDRMDLGPFTIHLAGTEHASENAFVYHGASGALFQDDHYHGLYTDEPTRVQRSALTLRSILGERGVEVSLLLSGHARKAEQWALFEKSATRPDAGDLCPTRRPICADRALKRQQ